MKGQTKFLMAAGMIILLFGLPSCQQDEPLAPELKSAVLTPSANDYTGQNGRTHYSQAKPLGEGNVKAWIAVDLEGNPIAVGVKLSEEALINLPGEMTSVSLTLPKNKGKNFYTHVTVDWNPHGHEPFFYEHPHFDFHFYAIPESERMMIPGGPGFDTPSPDPQYIPQDYMAGPGIVPQMGAHWIDGLAPELPWNGGHMFTHTFIWGSYQGNFIFWEPMITMEYLMSQPDETFEVKQPAAYKRDGWYAHNYGIQYNPVPGEYVITLQNLQFHEGE